MYKRQTLWLRPTELRAASPEDARPICGRPFASPAPLDAGARVVLQLVDLGFATTRLGVAIERGRSWRVTPWSPAATDRG